MKSVIIFRDGTTVQTTAHKKGGRWFVGGDVANAIFETGATVLIYSKGKIFKLIGCYLKFQDYDADYVRN